MWNKKYILILVLASVFYSMIDGYAQQTAYTTRITWPAVEGAGGYVVEIQNGQGRQVYRQKTETNVIRPKLSSGEYRMRITVLDLFDREASSSEWVKLSVIKSEIPVFNEIIPHIFNFGIVADNVEITGENFLDGCTVKLVQGDRVISALKTVVKTDEKIICSFDLTKASEGSYSLILENPAGKRSVNDGKVIVSSNMADELPVAANGAPVIGKIYPSSVFLRKENIQIELFGKNLDEKCSVVFISGAVKIEAKILKFDGMYLTVEIPEKTVSAGEYDVTVTRVGKSDTMKSALHLNDAQSGYLGLKGLYLGIGYDAIIPLPAWNSILNNGYAGGSLYAGHSLEGLFNADWLKYIGAETSIGFSYFNTKVIANRRSGSLTFIPITAGLYGKISPIMPQLDFIVRFDGGIAGSYLSMSGGGTSRNVSSTDVTYSAGGSFRYTFDIFYTELGGDYLTCLYKGEPFVGTRFFMRAGMRL